MTFGGVVFMTFSWGLILALSGYCFYKILK
jgi:hypothetical protein